MLRTQISQFSIELHRITELVNNCIVTVNQYDFTRHGISIYLFFDLTVIIQQTAFVNQASLN